MPRLRLTSAGRLTAGVRRRKLKGTEPGAAVILSQARARKTVGGVKQTFRGKSLIEIGFRVEKDLVADFDIRKLVDELRLSLAAHYSASLLAGVNPRDGLPLPALSDNTLRIYSHPGADTDESKQAAHRARRDQSMGSRAGGFGVRTGHLARNWGIGPIRGSTIRARSTIFPTTDAARATLVVQWLKRTPPVDLQSVDGISAKVITDTVNMWMAAAIGETVSTPERVRTAGGTLATLGALSF